MSAFNSENEEGDNTRKATDTEKRDKAKEVALEAALLAFYEVFHRVFDTVYNEIR